MIPSSYQTLFSAGSSLCLSVSSVCVQILIHAAQRTFAQTLFPTNSHRLATIYSQRITTPFPGDILYSLLARWLTSQDLFLFKHSSNLPCCGMRKRRTSLYSNILLPCNSRVATRSRILITFSKIMQRTSEKVKESPNR